jgi:multiple sugar transport system permease protein
MTGQALPTRNLIGPANAAEARPGGKGTGLRASRVVGKALTYLVLTAFSAVFIFPLLFTISCALKSNEQMFVIPPVWIPQPIVFEHTIKAWTYLPFSRYTLNTLIVTLANSTGHLLCASLVAFGFARLRAPGRDRLFAVLLATLMLPGQVTMIPNYILMKYLGWLDTFLPLIVPAYLGGAGGAFFIFLLRQFMLGISTELDDAARIDGCSSFRVFWNIVLPLTKPALGAVAIFTFVGNWNDFLGPLIYINQQTKFTIALGLRLYQLQVFGGAIHGPTIQGLLGVSLIVLLPVVVVFFLAQKQFIQGITFTGLKG